MSTTAVNTVMVGVGQVGLAVSYYLLKFRRATFISSSLSPPYLHRPRVGGLRILPRRSEIEACLAWERAAPIQYPVGERARVTSVTRFNKDRNPSVARCR
jgi:hypothetical protein